MSSGLMLALLLSACGGGGSESDAPAASTAAVQLRVEAGEETGQASVASEDTGPTMDTMAVRRTTTTTVKAGTTNFSTSGWSTWSKNLKSIFSGPYNLIGDPSVLRDGTQLRMAYNCFDPMRQRGAVCEALSTDGINWTDAPINDGIAGRLIQTRAGQWDDAQETPLIYKRGKETLLFFSGYMKKGSGFVDSFPAHLGLAISTDGVDFTRYGSDPVLKTTPGGYDNDALFSPSIVEHNGQLVMIYTGHCWTNCPNGMGVFLLAATSTDGRTWTKMAKPIISKAELPMAKDGAGEADIVKGPDGYYYLFMSLLQGDSGHNIGVARSATPFGPWDVNPSPILKGTIGEFDGLAAIAPSVMIENGKVRMWFHGFGADNTIRIGYAEAPWPLRQQ